MGDEWGAVFHEMAIFIVVLLHENHDVLIE